MSRAVLAPAPSRPAATNEEARLRGVIARLERENAELRDRLADRATPALGLTTVQQRALDALAQHIGANGVAPTYRELAKVLGFASTSGVYRVLDQLEARGAIQRSKGRQQTIALILRPAHASATRDAG